MHVNVYKDQVNGHVMGRNFSMFQHIHRHVSWVTLGYEDIKTGSDHLLIAKFHTETSFIIEKISYHTNIHK